MVLEKSHGFLLGVWRVGGGVHQPLMATIFFFLQVNLLWEGDYIYMVGGGDGMSRHLDIAVIVRVSHEST